jgi:hypothetical protein
MFPRHKYKEVPAADPSSWAHVKDPAGTIKYDGANFWMNVSGDGSLSFISRRPSVKGGYPDRTASLPHITDKKYPEFAGHVYNVELIHTGFNKSNPESHRAVSGILNSLPARAISTQQATGPVRVVLHNTLNPSFPTYREKLLHMKRVEEVIGKPDMLFVAEPHVTPASIKELIQRTKARGQEGVIITSLSEHEDDNLRLKIKHKLLLNLRITNIIQEVDKDGNLKNSMGAVEVSDSTGKPVGKVGTGFSRNQRTEAWEHPELWMGRVIQVSSMGIAAKALGMPVFNGDADGDVDEVPINVPSPHSF